MHYGRHLSRVPFALIRKDVQGLRIAMSNDVARESGVYDGMRLTDALALLPNLTTQQETPEADARVLRNIAEWCQRYTPTVGIDGANGLWLDISGAAHLCGGEEALLVDLQDRLHSMGFANDAGLADTPGAAWGLARFARAAGVANVNSERQQHTNQSSSHSRIIPPGGILRALAPLPVEALRLDVRPLHLLKRFGLKTVGDLCAIPRANLKRRFPEKDVREAVLHRLDQALGAIREPIIPLYPKQDYIEQLCFADPILAPESFHYGLQDLLDRLCHRLEQDLQGATRLTFSACHADGDISRVRIATARPSRDAEHISLLFRERIDTLNPGFGVDRLVLSADTVSRLVTEQLSLAQNDCPEQGGRDVTCLIDRLSNRLGADRVLRRVPNASHIPERAESCVQAIRVQHTVQDASCWKPPRPVRLLMRPEPIDVIAEVPEGPPLRFIWRRVAHRVVLAEGPERIAPEWWVQKGLSETTLSGPPSPTSLNLPRTRDYYRVEDEEGRRFWLYRDGLYRDFENDETADHPSWHMHGVFA